MPRRRSFTLILTIAFILESLWCAGPGTSMRTTDQSGDELERSGDALFKNGDFPMAFVQYERLLRLDPENTSVLYKKGRTLLAGKMHEEAIKAFQEVLDREPDHAMAHAGIGQAYFAL